MPFTFKLSQRLARMYDLGLSSSAAGRLLPVAGPRLPANVVVSLDAISLSPCRTHHAPRRVAPQWATGAANL
jgi:hypothetical protein